MIVCKNCGHELTEINITPDYIIKTVCDYFKTTREVISQLVKYREIIYPRQLCYYFIKRHTNLNNRQAGSYFNQHNSTVIHSVESIEDLLCVDKVVRIEVEEINNLLINNVEHKN